LQSSGAFEGAQKSNEVVNAQYTLLGEVLFMDEKHKFVRNEFEQRLRWPEGQTSGRSLYPPWMGSRRRSAKLYGAFSRRMLQPRIYVN
jgi:hypothetical protein